MTKLIGHDDVIATFRAALDGPRLHHGWIFAGPKGVGKAQLANQLAMFHLARAAGPAFAEQGLYVPEDHPIRKSIEGLTHPDFIRIIRLPRKSEKGEITDDTKLARNISVEQIRTLREQLHRTPSLSPQRIVMIDAAEDMEAGAANALLKILEEPPANTMFFLISHMPGRLLPTIRSRCRSVRLRPLEDEQVANIVAQELPELDMESCMALARAAQGSPGQALLYADLDVAGIEAVLFKVESADPQAAASRSTLARQMAGKGAQARFELFLDYFPSRLARSVRRSDGAALAEGITLWERACELANSARRLSLDPESTVYELTGYLAAFTASSLNLSRKP